MKTYSVKNLKLINNIEFTNRELDILACVFNGRSPKVIGSFLFISTRTVETHLHNIMTKIACNSRQAIINFIETSQHSDVLRQHYLTLLKRAKFTSLLKGIVPYLANTNLKCKLIFHKKTPSDLPIFLNPLIKDLEFLGIQVSLSTTETLSPEFFSLLVDPLLNNKYSKRYSFRKDDYEKEYFKNFFSLLKKILSSYSLHKILHDISLDDLGASSSILVSNAQQSPHSRFFTSFFYKSLLSIIGTSLGIVSLYYVSTHNLLPSTNEKRVVARSDLQIPNKKYFLKRHNLLNEIEHKFHAQQGIKVAVLVGMGGTGKTTLARQYAREQQTPIVWEINAETRESLINSFEELGDNLAESIEEKKELQYIQKLDTPKERERKLIIFIKKALKKFDPWFLLYDNLESFSSLLDFFPQDTLSWGTGSILITTQDANIRRHKFLSDENIINIPELTEDEKFTLFSKISSDKNIYTKNTQAQVKNFLKKICSFPLDVSAAAFYINDTGISYEDYIKRTNVLSDEFEESQSTLLWENGDYKKTRYGTITLSLKKLLNEYPEFSNLLMLLTLLHADNIPVELLYRLQNHEKVENFIRKLRKYSFLTKEKNSEGNNQKTFSIHRNVQIAAKAYLKKHKKNNRFILFHILKAINEYTSSILEEGNYSKLKLLLPHYEALLKHLPALEPRALGHIKANLGKLYQALGYYDKALSTLNESLEIFKVDPGNKFIALSDIGYTYCIIAKYKKAIEKLFPCFQYIKRRYGTHHTNTAKIALELATANKYAGNYDEAEHLYKESLSIYQLHKNISCIARAYTHLGHVYTLQGRYKDALVCFKKTFSYYKNNQDNLGYAWYLRLLSCTYNYLGEHSKAINILNKCLREYTNAYGVDHRKFLEIWYNLGTAYLGTKQLQNAAYYIKKIKTTYQTYPDMEIRNDLTPLLYTSQKNYRAAQKLLIISLADYAIYYGRTHIRTAEILNELGKTYILQGKIDKGVNLIKTALDIFTKANHPSAYISLELLATVFLTKEGRYFNPQTGQAYLKKALIIIKNHFPKNSPHIDRIKNKIKMIKNI